MSSSEYEEYRKSVVDSVIVSGMILFFFYLCLGVAIPFLIDVHGDNSFHRNYSSWRRIEKTAERRQQFWRDVDAGSILSIAPVPEGNDAVSGQKKLVQQEEIVLFRSLFIKPIPRTWKEMKSDVFKITGSQLFEGTGFVWSTDPTSSIFSSVFENEVRTYNTGGGLSGVLVLPEFKSIPEPKRSDYDSSSGWINMFVVWPRWFLCWIFFSGFFYWMAAANISNKPLHPFLLRWSAGGRGWQVLLVVILLPVYVFGGVGWVGWKGIHGVWQCGLFVRDQAKRFWVAVNLWREDAHSPEREEIAEAKSALRTLMKQGGDEQDIFTARELLEALRKHGREARKTGSRPGFFARWLELSEAVRRASLDRAKEKIELLQMQLKDPKDF
ncbi:MAG TPA: hypothetical protein VJB99_03065 [Patescibacteria group bacterium]|nr:hypothetical protein [Patescibacteria group bacterium]